MKKNNLTEKEKSIIICLAKGMKRREISEALNISEHTTKTHIETIYEKLKVHNRIQAAVKSVRNGLVEFDDIV